MSILILLVKLLTLAMVMMNLFGMLWFYGTLSELVVLATIMKVTAALYMLVITSYKKIKINTINRLFPFVALLIFSGALFLEYTTLSEYISKYGLPGGKILMNSIFFISVSMLVLVVYKKQKTQ